MALRQRLREASCIPHIYKRTPSASETGVVAELAVDPFLTEHYAPVATVPPSTPLSSPASPADFACDLFTASSTIVTATSLSDARATALVPGAARATSDGPQLTPHKEQRKMDAPAARRAPAPPPDRADALLGVACCGADDGATIEPAAPKYSYDEVVPKDSPLCREEMN